MQLIECIPNFSEGRRQDVIDQILAEIKSVKGVIFLDCKSDPDHNRSVVSFAGAPEPVLEAAYRSCKKAGELIDLNTHTGEHPRMGATDVIPLIPLEGVTMDECVAFAEKLGQRIADEAKIPVYLYEKAAKTPERENLAKVRKGQFEGIKAEIMNGPERAPDFGPRVLTGAGITAVGAREALVAYNVNLGTADLEIAKKIAFDVRHKSGGFRFVKAMGFTLEDKGIVQVSMNLTNYKKTAIAHVFEMIKREAAMYGVPVLESEIIGLIPETALFDVAKYYLQAHNFEFDQVLERKLRQQSSGEEAETMTGFLNELASKSPAPGGGSVSALAGALAAGLGSMVANLTVSRKKYEAVHAEMKVLLEETERARGELHALIEQDAQAYKQVMVAYKSEEAGKQERIEASLKEAAMVPLKIAQTAIKLVKPLEQLVVKGNPNAITDCGVALYLVEAAVKGAILNVKINLKEIKDQEFFASQTQECQQLLVRLLEVKAVAEQVVV